MKIVTIPSGILRKKAVTVMDVGTQEKELMNDMTNIMYSTGGVGLAAPQIGISKNILIADTGKELLKMANAKILSRRGSTWMEEGCLSVPQKTVKVKRAQEIKVSYIDENNMSHTKTFKGMSARIIQHEIDHINAKLIIDYLPWHKKIFSKISS